MPEADVNGIRLYYEEHGEGAPIACVHGAGSSAVMVGRGGREAGATRAGYLIWPARVRAERAPGALREHDCRRAGRRAAELLDALEAVPAIVMGRSYGARWRSTSRFATPIM